MRPDALQVAVRSVAVYDARRSSSGGAAVDEARRAPSKKKKGGINYSL